MRRLFGCGICGLLFVAAFFAWGCGENEPASRQSELRYDKDGNLLGEHERPVSPPNLVLIVIDTLRADAVALPGARAQGYMPFVSSLAREGISFANATSVAPWTLPSITSMLTGVMPHEHGVTVADTTPSLDGRFTTVAEALRNGYGYEALAFAAGPWFDHRNSIWQGFRAQSGGFMMQGAKPLLQEWVSALEPGRPFFLMLHSFEAHDPYGERNHPYPKSRSAVDPRGFDPSQVTAVAQQTREFLTDRNRRLALQRRWGRRFNRDVMRYMHAGYREDSDPELAAHLADAYWDGVRWVDGLVKQTVDVLRAWKLLDDTLLIITSDHGEAFGEHGTLEHGRQLYDELLRVPLVMIDFRKDAGRQAFRGGRVFRGPVATIDILPTFFAYAGMQPLDDVHGRSFLERVAADDRAAGHPVFSEEILGYTNTAIPNTDAMLTSARTDRWKYILTHDRNAGTITEELYDLAEDPAEEHDLVELKALETVKSDVGFCAAVEAVRDRLWGAVPGAERPPNDPYRTSLVQRVSDPRPKPWNATSGR